MNAFFQSFKKKFIFREKDFKLFLKMAGNLTNLLSNLATTLSTTTAARSVGFLISDGQSLEAGLLAGKRLTPGVHRMYELYRSKTARGVEVL